jgi:biopolymer transport protein ExbD
MSKITVNQTLLDEINAKAARETFKTDRQTLVDSIVVEVDGKLFDGDETAQTRMARAISAMEDDETTLWVLADNTVHYPTKVELKEALRLAGAEQTRVWVSNG